jgi:phosphatidyl-myo-inositol dimannoside synthase
MRRHLLVTNDFPPKVGGIQSYLWELWRRLNPATFVVLTAASHCDHARFDAEQAARGLQIVRVPSSTLYLPTPSALHHIRSLARETGASLVVFDPALPLGLLGPGLGLPYVVILHGAEVAAPGRLPVSRQAFRYVLQHASLAICAGHYAGVEARAIAGLRMPPAVEVPPGVDCERFVPLAPATRAEARARLGLPQTGPLVVSVSRLVPRKGMDVLAEAGRRLVPSFPDLTMAIGGRGREERRLQRLASATGSPVRLIGSVSDADLPDLLGAADVFAMACRTRWMGLEPEGFGIVFLEAAAAGVPQVAGDSGGAAEAVEDGVSGFVVRRPRDPAQVAGALRRVLADEPLRCTMGAAARRRAKALFDYSKLAPRLAGALAGVES